MIIKSTVMEHDPAKYELAAIVTAALKELSPAEFTPELSALFSSITRPPERELGDFALPCFRFAKDLRKKPDLVAADLKAKLEEKASPWIREIEVKGAFLNIFLDQKYLARKTIPEILDGSRFKVFRGSRSSEKVMVEFSQPNTHKEFHIGHARNVCLGDTISRLLTYTGYTVVPVNYIGDEGTHVAKCLWQLGHQTEQRPQDLSAAEWYGKNYIQAHAKLEAAAPEEKEVFQKEISAILKELEAKKGPRFELWRTSRAECLEDFDRIYKWLDVNFEHVFYESEFTERAHDIVDEYLAKGVFAPSDGAIGIDMEPYKLGFFMARKSDGTTLYITKDLALAETKFAQFGIDRSVYVVASEQNLHFQQLFKALELMGFPQAKDCYHLSYAHVRLPEGKMSSRVGNVVSLSALTTTLEKELAVHLEKYQGDWPQQEITETTHNLALSALRYGMLKADPSKEIIFSIEDWISFEGHTGPYLLYSYARTASILRKAEQLHFTAREEDLDHLEKESEFALLSMIYDFNDTVKQAAEHYRPSTLCQYLYALCKSFNRFYADSSVLNAENDRVRGARILLIKAFATSLKEGLKLLGMTPPERM